MSLWTMQLQEREKLVEVENVEADLQYVYSEGWYVTEQEVGPGCMKVGKISGR